MSRYRTGIFALTAVVAIAASGCAQNNPLEPVPTGDTERPTLVIGSQDYYSNEIIAEIYAQALEEAGYTVQRDFRIGQREVYMPEIESGAIDVFPEYTGNLLQYFDADTTATSADDVYAALQNALPDGLRVLDQSNASDQDSYVVTSEFASEHGLSEISDLAGIDGLVLGGNSELETRPYGPEGLQSVYGVTVSFTPIEDSGGPLTLKALRDNQVQLVNIYSADPSLSADDLLVLQDPEGLFLASHVVPVVSENVDTDAAAILNAISAAMTAQDLVTLNAASVNEQSPAATIAANWLAEQNL